VDNRIAHSLNKQC